MAKSTNGGKPKAPTAANGDAKARRAPARRRTDKKAADAPVAMASELATSERQAASQSAVVAARATGLTAVIETADLNPEDVRRKAYELYISRGCTNGCDVDDWLEAERQLRGRRAH